MPESLIRTEKNIVSEKRTEPEPNNGLRQAFTQQVLQSLSEVAELKAEVRVGMGALDEKLDRSLQSVHDKLDRLLILEKKVDEHSTAITRLKTVWSVLAAAIAFGAAFLKDWLFHTK